MLPQQVLFQMLVSHTMLKVVLLLHAKPHAMMVQPGCHTKLQTHNHYLLLKDNKKCSQMDQLKPLSWFTTTSSHIQVVYINKPHKLSLVVTLLKLLDGVLIHQPDHTGLPTTHGEQTGV